MFRRMFLLLLVFLAAGPVVSADKATAASLWAILQSGRQIVLIRHAATEPGVGDPPGFTIGECGTQRNLSAKGRADAKRIGAAFRTHGVPVSAVLSSRWCRCIDTAQLAFGRVQPAPMLDSMFDDSTQAAGKKAAEVFAAVARYKEAGNLILVTHARNIERMTGVSPSSGEMVIVAPDGARKFRLIGRLDVPES